MSAESVKSSEVVPLTPVDTKVTPKIEAKLDEAISQANAPDTKVENTKVFSTISLIVLAILTLAVLAASIIFIIMYITKFNCDCEEPEECEECPTPKECPEDDPEANCAKCAKCDTEECFGCENCPVDCTKKCPHTIGKYCNDPPIFQNVSFNNKYLVLNNEYFLTLAALSIPIDQYVGSMGITRDINSAVQWNYNASTGYLQVSGEDLYLIVYGYPPEDSRGIGFIGVSPLGTGAYYEQWIYDGTTLFSSSPDRWPNIGGTAALMLTYYYYSGDRPEWRSVFALTLTYVPNIMLGECNKAVYNIRVVD